MTDGLRDVHRTAIVDLLRANKRVERAVLFGSRATETFTPVSDVDIALFGETLMTTDQTRLAAAMEELNVPQRVDLLLYDRIEDKALRRHVRRDGVELYRRQVGPATQLYVPEEHCQTLISLLLKHLPSVEVWAYGSRVSGRSHIGSNLELVLRGPELKEIDIGQLSDFDRAVRESRIPFPVEARDWARLPERFHRAIKRKHAVLIEPPTGNRKWKTVNLGECIMMNVATYSPKEGWPFVNYLDTGSITKNRIEAFDRIDLDTEKLPSRARRKVERGDIVFSTERPNQRHFGLLKDVPDNALASTAFAVLRARHNVAETDFIYWFLTQDQVVDQLHTVAEHSTSAYPSIRPADIEKLEIALPPLPEQRAIAYILGTLDDKIDLNRRMNETLEAMARAIFRDWFIDFGPTRSKAEGRAPYLAPGLWDLFPDALDGEGKPKGWRVRPASELFEFNPRESIKKGTFAPYLDMAALPLSGAVADAPKNRKYKSGSKFRDGDTLFARITPSLENGKTAYVFDLGSNAVGGGSTEFIVIRAREPLPKISSYILARDADFRRYAEHRMTGTSGRQRVNYQELAQYKLTIPINEYLWRAFGDFIGPLIDRIITNAGESRTLTQTRDLLLPKLMSGKIQLAEDTRGLKAVA